MLSPTQKLKLRSAIKQKDGWWASIFSGPLANRLLEPICDISWISPNLITVNSFLIGMIAAWCFACGDHLHLIIGAALVQLSFAVDCMDGQLARYRQQFSKLGAWLDRVSDRVKDFIYFFSLAWGFFTSHEEFFFLNFSRVSSVIEFFLGVNGSFKLPVDFQMMFIKSFPVATWLIWPLAMIAMFTVLLIDYYVNQDMKLEPAVQRGSQASHEDSVSSLRGVRRNEVKTDDVAIQPLAVDPDGRASPSLRMTIIKSILNFGLSVYRAIPILRFNIGEQALLISIFTALNMVFTLLVIFALLGSFYCVYWPVAKYMGFSPEE